jgi:dihydrofolate reductase
MRKLIVSNIVSLDGYYEGPGRDVTALPLDPAFDAYNAERLRAADTLLLGRTTYESFKGFWPGVAGDPSFTPTHWEISRRDDAIDKVVVSDSLTPEQTAPWTGTTTIVKRAEAGERVAELKRRPGGDILVFGSRTLWNGLLAQGLVDELHLMVGAVMLGGGTALLDAEWAVSLRRIGVRTWDGSGSVLVSYAVGASARDGARDA